MITFITKVIFMFKTKNLCEKSDFSHKNAEFVSKYHFYAKNDPLTSVLWKIMIFHLRMQKCNF